MLTSVVLMLMALLSAAGAAGIHSTITSLMLASNYRNTMQVFYELEGTLSKASVDFGAGTDLDGSGQEDFDEVHGNNQVVYYTAGGHEITISRFAGDPHLVVINVDGRMEIVVNNFPGGGVSCVHSGQCTPELVAWREL